MVFSRRTGTDPETGINYDRMKKYRIERAQEMMSKYGIGALITYDEVNGQYLAGGGGHNEDGYVVFPRNGSPYMCGPMAAAPAGGGQERSEVQTRSIVSPRPCDTVSKDELDNMLREVGNIMEEHGLKNEPLAIDGTASAIIMREAFIDAGIKVVHDNRVMTEARLIKNEDEIACLRVACAHTGEFFAAVKDKIRPGVTECELVGFTAHTMCRLSGTGGKPTVVSGERTNPPVLQFTDRLIRPGELVFIDPHNSYERFEACCWRTFCCGKATAEQKEIYAEAREILYAGLSAVKAGNTALDVVEKWPSDPRRYGADNWEEIEFLVSGHGLGLGRGTSYPGMGRSVDYPRRFHPGLPKDILEKIVFEENMTLALETWNGKLGGNDGVYIEEDIVVTKDGYELLTKFSVDELTECLY